MNVLHDYFGLLGCMILLIATPLVFIRRPRFSRKAVTIFLFTMLGVSILPIYDLPVIAYIRGVSGDLSITSMALLSIFIAEAYTGQHYLIDFEKRRMQRLLLTAGLVLYPFALGLSSWDSYAAGYGSIWFALALLLVSICLVVGQSWTILGILWAATLAYLVGILGSTNLWDYLIDIWLFLLVVMQVLSRFFRHLFVSKPDMSNN